jgi:hypothetical protein
MAQEICKKNGAKTPIQKKDHHGKRATQYERCICGTGANRAQWACVDALPNRGRYFPPGLPASGHEMGHGNPDAPGVIERYGENFDLQTGSRSNFRSL